MVLVRVVEEAEGLPEAVVATTAPVGTTQTQVLKPMHQQHPGVMVPAEVAVVASEAVVVVVMEVDVEAEGNTSDMTPAAEGKKHPMVLDSCDAAASQQSLETSHSQHRIADTRQRRSMGLDVATGELRRKM